MCVKLKKNLQWKGGRSVRSRRCGSRAGLMSSSIFVAISCISHMHFGKSLRALTLALISLSLFMGLLENDLTCSSHQHAHGAAILCMESGIL
jgi:hypothetical protein